MRLAGDEPNETRSIVTITANQWNALEIMNQGGEKDMMGLYEVYVVDTKKNTKVLVNDIIAKNEERAKMTVCNGFDAPVPEECEFFVRCIGQWESRKPKEVKIVKEE